MRIGIDARNLTDKNSGLVNYVYNLIIHLLHIDSNNEYVLFVNKQYLNYLTQLYSSYRNVTLVAVYYCNNFLDIRNLLFEQIIFPATIRKFNLDVFHNPFGFGIPGLLQIPKIILTVHDVIPLSDYDELSYLQKLTYKFSLLQSIRKCSTIVCISQFTKDELVKKIPEVKNKEVLVILNGYDKLSNQNNLDSVFADLQKKFDITKPYIAYVGSATKRKNLVNMVKGYAMASKRGLKQYKLIIISKFNRPQTKKYLYLIQDVLQKEGLENKAVFTGYLSNSKKAAILKNCEMFIYPSVYEGFGLPILEAMSFNKPVLCSNIPPFKEICQNSAIHFNPEDPNDIARCIMQVANNSHLRNELISKSKLNKDKFSWEKMADQYRNVYLKNTEKIKVGLMITPSHAVPPRENIILAPWHLVSILSDLLAQREHIDTYLFAAKTSVTLAKLYDFGITPTAQYKSVLSTKDYLIKRTNDEANLFNQMIKVGKTRHINLFHLHQTAGMDELIKLAPEFKFLITIHDTIEDEKINIISNLAKFKNVFLVSISDAQRNGLSIPFIRTIYNGTIISEFPFGFGGERMCSVGRIIPQKGQDEAVLVAKRIKTPIDIIGEANITANNPTLTETYSEFWQKKILPYIDGKIIRHISVMPRSELFKYYQNSKLMLFTPKWEEPFGLTMIESMACGTPVVAFARGSVPEVIKDGETGFIVNSSDTDIRGNWIVKKTGIEGLCEAVEKIYSMPTEQYQQMRRNCRAHVEKNFTVERMVDEYEKVYEEILSKKS